MGSVVLVQLVAQKHDVSMLNQSTVTRIAGSFDVNDWVGLSAQLVPGRDLDSWELAFEAFFRTRLAKRYLDPIEHLQVLGDCDGEGFSIVAIQCTLIEFLATTFKGLNYRLIRNGDPPLGDYEYGNGRSGFICSDFLSTREPFQATFSLDLAKDFYAGVRCAVLHEARTRDGWLIQRSGEATVRLHGSHKVLFRDNLQKDILDYVELYRNELLASPERQAAFKRKFDSICS